ncbi:MAG TPA: type II toxin-antitoxin system VapB family antitoxin [Nevskiaceae bacterium]|nr:type II toxin-antitoxin system VapB family antitoxin [Nevskiaceae bacterium]
MATARVFKSGNSQAVRLPKAFRFDSREVEIFKRGDEVVLRERRTNLADAFDLLAGLPDDMIDAITQARAQSAEEREGL